MLPVMKSLADAHAEMVWTRTRTFPNAWELRAGEELVGTLRWPRFFRSNAEGETSEGRLISKCTGFLSMRTEATDAATGERAAVFQRRFGGNGEVTFPDGRRVLWTCQGWFPRIPLFSTSDGFPIMRFPAQSRWLRSTETLEIEETARGMRELSLLALLGRYLIVLSHRGQQH